MFRNWWRCSRICGVWRGITDLFDNKNTVGKMQLVPEFVQLDQKMLLRVR
jgi:hypothetical protein